MQRDLSADLAFLSGGGETGALMRAHDWTQTPLGPPENWPQSLRTLIGLMLGSNQAMFLIWGPERIKFYNDAYAPVLGKRHPAAMGTRFNDIWTDIIDDVGPLVDRAYAGQSTLMENMPLRMFRNGYWEETHFTFFYTPIRTEDGAVGGMFCACADTTARVRAEAERLEAMLETQKMEKALQRLNETLEMKVIERTVELERAQAALRQSQKMEAVGQLTGGLAHDFNNLLQAINGHLQLVRYFPHDERVRQWADNGLRAVGRGAKLASQLLAFSRVQHLELKAVCVENLINGMAELLTRTLGPSIQIDFALHAENNTVLTDATQLELAVLNLAINARDAMPGGGGLHIATAVERIEQDNELEPGLYVALSVSDTGSGMSHDVQTRAFDPFFTTKGVGKGTGLGLSQVYGFARQAGGTARLRSEEGRGTTVTLLLRQTESALHEAADAPGTMRIDHGTRSAEILVVDDDKEVRQLLCELLSNQGFAVKSAIDGPSALAQVLQSRPDVLVLDFAMPGMNGAEMATTVRKTHPTLPIIFSTGYSDTSSLHAAVGADATVLRKPFQIEELLTAIDLALKPAQAGGPH